MITCTCMIYYIHIREIYFSYPLPVKFVCMRRKSGHFSRNPYLFDYFSDYFMGVERNGLFFFIRIYIFLPLCFLRCCKKNILKCNCISHQLLIRSTVKAELRRSESNRTGGTVWRARRGQRSIGLHSRFLLCCITAATSMARLLLAGRPGECFHLGLQALFRQPGGHCRLLLFYFPSLSISIVSSLLPFFLFPLILFSLLPVRLHLHVIRVK